MEPIQDLDELKRIVDGLMQKNLVVELTPAGRGQVVSHNLYPEWELAAVTKSVAAGISAAGVGANSEDSQSGSDQSPATARLVSSNSGLAAQVQALEEKVASLSQRLEKLELVFEKELGNNS
jgi:uncharacterized protein YceH (UPF0502 family)